MRSLLFWLIVGAGIYAFEVHRETPIAACIVSLAQFNDCAEKELTALYYNRDNPWKTWQRMLDNDSHPCQAGWHRVSGYYEMNGLKMPNCERD